MEKKEVIKDEIILKSIMNIFLSSSNDMDMVIDVFILGYKYCLEEKDK